MKEKDHRKWKVNFKVKKKLFNNQGGMVLMVVVGIWRL